MSTKRDSSNSHLVQKFLGQKCKGQCFPSQSFKSPMFHRPKPDQPNSMIEQKVKDKCYQVQKFLAQRLRVQIDSGLKELNHKVI